MQVGDLDMVVIHAADMSVSVSGVTFECLTPDMLLPNMNAIRWTPYEKPRGHFHGMPFGSYEFDDFAVLAPFLAAWQAASDAAAAHSAAAKLEADEKAAAEKAAADANAKLLAEQQPLSDAWAALAAGDHTVLKAAEAFLVQQGLLPPDFAAQRNAQRAAVKAGKIKFGIK